jgi:hypothetical protein
MASIIKLKRSSTATAVPANSSLQAGELAINLADKKLYSANASGHTIQISGDAYTVGPLANTTSGTILLEGSGNAANSQVNLVGANGITVTSNTTAVIVTANTVDVDFATVANTSSANLVVGSGAGDDVVKLSGNNGLVVAATNTTNIVVENKGAEHTVTVAGGKFVIDGTSQQALRLVPGVIYWFDQSDSSNGSHPLHFSTTSDGTHNSGSQLSQGTGSGFIIYEKVGTPGSAGAYTRIKLQQDAGNVYYYYCANHSGMGGAAYVQPDNLYGNATHTVATQQLDVAGNTNLGDSLTVADGLTISASGATITGAVDITGAANVSSTLGVDGVVDIDDATNSTSTSTGSLVTAGGVGIAKSVQIGEDLTVAQDIGARNIVLSGNLTVQGTTTTVQSTTVNINDNMLSLADNQTGTDADAVDIGFYGNFDEGGTDKFSGLFRDKSHSAKAFVFVEGITTEPAGEVTYNAANSSSTGNLAQVDAIIDGGTY